MGIYHVTLFNHSVSRLGSIYTLYKRHKKKLTGFNKILKLNENVFNYEKHCGVLLLNESRKKTPPFQDSPLPFQERAPFYKEHAATKKSQISRLNSY